VPHILRKAVPPPPEFHVELVFKTPPLPFRRIPSPACCASLCRAVVNSLGLPQRTEGHTGDDCLRPPFSVRHHPQSKTFAGSILLLRTLCPPLSRRQLLSLPFLTNRPLSEHPFFDTGLVTTIVAQLQRVMDLIPAQPNPLMGLSLQAS